MKSLEIVNKHIQFIDEHSTQIKGTPVMIDELQQIKQDLEDYFIIREIEEKVREGKMVIRNGKKYYPCEFILAEQGTIRHLTIWYDDYKKVLNLEDYKKTWKFED